MIIAGNWKMNLAPAAAKTLVAEFLKRYEPAEKREVILFPPALAFEATAEALRGRGDIRVGLQNIYWEESGAYTGEISAAMAAAAGAAFCLVGHSERRHIFGETIDDTRRKASAVAAAGMTPLLCVGETLAERQDNRAETIVQRQLEPVLDELASRDAKALAIAYEPVWAIGTGETASPADAAGMHAHIRALLAARPAFAHAPILYGGSVKPTNAAELLSQPEVGGVLVGGASLDAAAFAAICVGAP